MAPRKQHQIGERVSGRLLSYDKVIENSPGEKVSRALGRREQNWQSFSNSSRFFEKALGFDPRLVLCERSSPTALVRSSKVVRVLDGVDAEIGERIDHNQD